MNELGENAEGGKSKEEISDNLFTKVFHASSDSISVSRMSDGVFLDVNEGFERISGYSHDEVIGRSSLGFGFWADGPQHRDAFIHELKTRGSVRDFEGRWLTRTNEIRDCLIAGEMIEYQGEKCLVLVITDITARLRAQHELERSEKLYRSIVADQTDFIVRWLPGGIRTFVNDAYCEYFGVSREDCIGTSFYSLVADEWRAGVQRKIDSLTPDNPVARSQHRVVRRDGTEGWNEWIDRAIFDHEGNAVEFQSVGRDITPSKRTQQALQQSESLLRNVADNSPNSIALKDRDGYYIMVNRAMAERNATTPGEMVGMRDTEFAPNWQMTPAALEAYLARDQEIIDSNQTVVLLAEEHTFRDGTARWYQTTKVPIALSGGKRGLLNVSVDVTEYKRAEEERRQAEEQYRRTFESVTNGLTVRDTDGHVVAVNPAMCELYGYTAEEYAQLSLTDLMPPEMYPLLDELRKSIGTGKTLAREAKGLHKSGRLMDLEIRVTPFQYRGREHTLTIAWDITERKRAEDQLVKLNVQLLAEREALDQKNTALHEVLSHLEQERENYKHEICESVEKLILPTVTKLSQKGGHIGPNEVARLKNALEAIIEKDLDVFSSNWTRLSARELDICELIKAGGTSKEIARKLNISLQTVHTHRYAIRRKLQIKNKGVNLAAYLRSR